MPATDKMIAGYIPRQKVVVLGKDTQERDLWRSMVDGWEFQTFSFGDETICLDNLNTIDPDIVVLGSFDPERSYRFINTVKAMNSNIPILIVSSNQLIETFVSANCFEDVHFIKDARQLHEIKHMIRQSCKDETETDAAMKCPLIIGNSSAMVKIKSRITELGSTADPIMIKGEPGTGKDHLAKVIHLRSHRRADPLVRAWIPATPVARLAREVFGHDDAIAGPRERKKGIFETAGRGTIVLDGIEDLSTDLQGELLQFVERIFVTGHRSDRDPADIKIIVLTSPSIDHLVENGNFRKDLYYRLGVICLEIPPLRHRREDIPLLIDYFSDKFCLELGRGFFGAADSTKRKFLNHRWPGNVLELEDLVKRVIVLGNEEVLDRKIDSGNQAARTAAISPFSTDIHKLANLDDLKEHLKGLDTISLKKICGEFTAKAEKNIMKQALQTTNWNRRKAASLLSISYKSMLNKIKEYELVIRS
ncbi:MAG: sigma 54-interacting transcriptional regulator [Desulfobacterales bacterium]|nr:sigma 54-interacting transcriptional regulator [Desulfobacterales bacterium]